MTDQAPANRQFVACVFREDDARSYTFHNDGEPVAIGDRVRVPGRKFGEQTATVSALVDAAPPFPTKPILGLAAPITQPGEMAGHNPDGPITSTPLPF